MDGQDLQDKDLRFQSCIPILHILSIHVNFPLTFSLRDDARALGERVSLLVCVREAEDC